MTMGSQSRGAVDLGRDLSEMFCFVMDDFQFSNGGIIPVQDDY